MFRRDYRAVRHRSDRPTFMVDAHTIKTKHVKKSHELFAFSAFQHIFVPGFRGHRLRSRETSGAAITNERHARTQTPGSVYTHTPQQLHPPPRPTSISTKSLAEHEKKGTRASAAMALASRVFPVPEGPDRRTPLGSRAPTSAYLRAGGTGKKGSRSPGKERKSIIRATPRNGVGV